MADKASRALVIFGDGLMPLVSISHSHLHILASQASCGFLSIRDSDHTEREDERVIRELWQLLDVYDVYVSQKELNSTANLEFERKLSVPLLSERFMGLKAAFFSTCPWINHIGEEAGFSVFSFSQLDSVNEVQDLPNAFAAASALLRLLGFSGGNVLEKSDYDMVFVHIYASENAEGQLIWLNELIGSLMKIAVPGSEVASRLHLSLLMGYGAVPKTENKSKSIYPDMTDARFSHLVPHQSFTMKGGRLLNDVRCNRSNIS